MKEVKNHWKKWVYWFLLGTAIIIVYKALDNFGEILDGVKKLFSILSPFLAGIFIAYLLYMPCKNIEKAYKKSKSKLIKKKSRVLSVATVYIIAALLLIILVNVILPVVVESVADLINNIQGYFETAINKYNELPENSILKGDIVKEAISNIQNIDVKQYFKLDKILEYVMGAVNAVTSIFNVFVAVIVSIYILMERNQII